MTKYIKTFVYMLAAYIIICIINSLVLSIEFILAMAPGAIHFPSDWDIDMAIWILVGINVVISLFTYIRVGIKIPKTNNVFFDILIIFLPFVLSSLCLIMVNDNIYVQYIVWGFNSSMGILSMFLHNSPIRYAISVFPSVCIFIGYMHYKVNSRSTKSCT